MVAAVSCKGPQHVLGNKMSQYVVELCSVWAHDIKTITSLLPFPRTFGKIFDSNDDILGAFTDIIDSAAAHGLKIVPVSKSYLNYGTICLIDPVCRLNDCDFGPENHRLRSH